MLNSCFSQPAQTGACLMYYRGSRYADWSRMTTLSAFITSKTHSKDMHVPARQGRFSLIGFSWSYTLTYWKLTSQFAAFCQLMSNLPSISHLQKKKLFNLGLSCIYLLTLFKDVRGLPRTPFTLDLDMMNILLRCLIIITRPQIFLLLLETLLIDSLGIFPYHLKSNPWTVPVQYSLPSRLLGYDHYCSPNPDASNQS